MDRKEGTRGTSDQLIEEIQSKYRSDRWSPVGKRFGLSSAPSIDAKPLKKLIQRSQAQGLRVNDPDNLSNDASNQLIEKLNS